MKVILASASPRRLSLLENEGLKVVVRPANVDEAEIRGESPEQHVLRLAVAKATAVAPLFSNDVVVGADTVVVAGNDRILGKPADADEARQMLACLSGRAHRVLTGACMTRFSPCRQMTWVCTTRVVFKDLSPEDISRYLQLVDVFDKAGAYAIQEHGDMLVKSTQGLVSNVIGLPVEEVLDRLPLF